MRTIRIDNTLCKRCGKCAKVCPANVIRKSDTGLPEVEGTSRCIECGHCVDVCASDAIHHEAFSPERIRMVHRELLPSPEGLMELMLSRRSNRTLTDQPISEEELRMIQEAALCAPTAENSRKVKLYIISEKEDLQRVEDKVLGFFTGLARILCQPVLKFFLKPFLRDLYARVPELMEMDEKAKGGERPCTCNAKILLVLTAPKNYDFGFQDCNLAYQNASLMAESLGISQIYMGFVCTALKMMGTRRTARLLNIPSEEKVFAMMALGKPAFHYPRLVRK